MPGSRIELQEEFRNKLFDYILSEKRLSLLELSREINCGYSGIKNWKSGKRLIPEDVFNLLLNMSNPKIMGEAKIYVLNKYPSNWGARLGGINSFKKYEKQIYSKMDHARSFKSSIKLPKVTIEIWELFGVLLGDGCLSKYVSKYDGRWQYELILTGNMKDDLKYYENNILPIMRSKFNTRAKYNLRPKNGVIEFRVKSKKLFDFFNKLGMPIGKKKYKIKIPAKIFDSPNNIKAAILRGLLDTDGCIFARKDEDYKYPYIKITSASLQFLNELKILIRQFDLPAYIHGDSVWVRGSKNIKVWMWKIGSSHPMVNKRYNEWLKTGKMLPKIMSS